MLVANGDLLGSVYCSTLDTGIRPGLYHVENSEDERINVSRKMPVCGQLVKCTISEFAMC